MDGDKDIMKLISKAIFPLMLSNCAIANTIYGLEHISGYRYSFKNPIYVQMGSFSSNAKAKTYQKTLQIKTHYKVFVTSEAGSYKVRIGPFYDRASLNKLAQNFNNRHVASSIPARQKSEVKINNPMFDFLNNV